MQTPTESVNKRAQRLHDVDKEKKSSSALASIEGQPESLLEFHALAIFRQLERN